MTRLEADKLRNMKHSENPCHIKDHGKLFSYGSQADS